MGEKCRGKVAVAVTVAAGQLWLAWAVVAGPWATEGEGVLEFRRGAQHTGHRGTHAVRAHREERRTSTPSDPPSNTKIS
ncbi:hypothetical protein Pcinc_002728 [Petrolisthes cinctipes]|uniref:Uncharacterized protein n=1 Tax=Petrolisthes cinctipes TaxID=88211 RepID=A0AAE1L1W2_PETCI|nr:hypothetical protein Pcinc_002728 [Petrolisthes cinctipes]